MTVYYLQDIDKNLVLTKTKIAEVDPVDNYPRRFLTSMKYPEEVVPSRMVSEPRRVQGLLRVSINSPRDYYYY